MDPISSSRTQVSLANPFQADAIRPVDAAKADLDAISDRSEIGRTLQQASTQPGINGGNAKDRGKTVNLTV